MKPLVVILLSCAVSAFGGIINPNAVDPSLFDVTTFASGLTLPAGIQQMPDGSLAILTSPGYYSLPGVVQDFPATGGAATPIYTSSADGLMTGTAQVGKYIAIGNDPVATGNDTITLLQPGATQGSPMTTVATLQLTYPLPWDHDTIGVAARPTPGQPGSYDLVVNVGSEYDNIATPPGSQVTLTGTGFSSIPATSLQGDSLYLIRIDESGVQPAVTKVQQVATGIRNVYGMGFNPVTGDFYFDDNAMDALPPGSSQPVEPDGEPPQADELNYISAANFANGTPPDFGFPNCYIQYEYGGVPGVPVGTGCVQPLLAFQPVTDLFGTHELEGATSLAFAPANFPAGWNDGVFVGFTGGENPNDEAGLAYYDIATGQYVHFIESLNPLIDNIVGIASTNDALFVADFGTGNVYEITAASPEPGTTALLAIALAALALGLRFEVRRSRSPI